jgi:hypothetical protein
MQAHDCIRCSLSRYQLRPCGCCGGGKHCGYCLFVHSYRALAPHCCPHLILLALSYLDWAARPAPH